MLLAYQSGAKYLTVFDYSPDGTGAGLLQDEHFNAMQRFWNDIHTKRFPDLSQPNAVMVLPSNYGWGMRNPNDTIWGFWSTDGKTLQIASTMSKLLATYGSSLDIIYDNSNYPITKINYHHIYYWNNTTI